MCRAAILMRRKSEDIPDRRGHYRNLAKAIFRAGKKKPKPNYNRASAGTGIDSGDKIDTFKIFCQDRR